MESTKCSRHLRKLNVTILKCSSFKRWLYAEDTGPYLFRVYGASTTFSKKLPKKHSASVFSNENLYAQYIFYTFSILSSFHLRLDPHNTTPIIQIIHLTLAALHSIRTKIVSVWIPEHIDFPEHEEIDPLDKNATSFTKITDNSLIPINNYKIYSCSLILQ